MRSSRCINIMICKKPGIVFDNGFFDHSISRPSPENSQRLRHLYLQLDSPAYNSTFLRVPPREATSEDLLAVHSSFYLDQIREHALNGDPFSYDRDTYLMELSLYTAQLAAGGCLELADRIMAEEIDYGFALIRPPGHHAEPGRGMGFCVLNNIAITAEYLRRKYNLQRILIFDFDIHHCNGTQAVFYDSDKVLVASIHQDKLFPFTGAPDETGSDKGRGYTVNLPVHAQFGDLEYIYLTGKVIGTLVQQYLPQMILVSAGYDGHQDDSISKTLLSTGWFTTVTEMLKYFAQESCNNRLLFVLEGGYNPKSLENSVLATLEALCKPVGPRVGIVPAERAAMILQNHPLCNHWTL